MPYIMTLLTICCVAAVKLLLLPSFNRINSLFAVPPSIRGGEQEVEVVENSQAHLVCVVEGVPQPSLSWEKDGIPLIESTGKYTILPSGELVIDSNQVRKTKTNKVKTNFSYFFQVFK